MVKIVKKWKSYNNRYLYGQDEQGNIYCRDLDEQVNLVCVNPWLRIKNKTYILFVNPQTNTQHKILR